MWGRVLAVVAFCATLFCFSQSNALSPTARIAVLFTKAPSTYIGPLDLGITSGTLSEFYSLGRVAGRAYASTATLLGDLYASGSTSTLVGTLRGSATGFVDLSAYFSGSTPSAACAASTGGSCVAGKLYGQIGGHNMTEQTAYIPVVFNQQNGLPCLVPSATNQRLSYSSALGYTLPLTLAAVFERTANFTNGGDGFGANIGINIGFHPTANTIRMTAGTELTYAASGVDSALHAAIGAFDTNTNADSKLVMDGTAVAGPGASGTSDFSAAGIGIGNSSNQTVTGPWCEGDVFTGAYMNSADYGTLNTNMHSLAYGWGF